jgi:hypothetical protein
MRRKPVRIAAGATVTDHVAGVTLTTEQSLTAVEK